MMTRNASAVPEWMSSAEKEDSWVRQLESPNHVQEQHTNCKRINYNCSQTPTWWRSAHAFIIELG